MRKSAIIISLLLFAALGLAACGVLPRDPLGPSVSVTALPGSSRTPDTGSVQGTSGTPGGTTRTDAGSPGDTVGPASGGALGDGLEDALGDAPGGPDTVDDPAAGDNSGDAPGNQEKDTNPYWIDVDVTAQQVRIMRGEEVVKTMTASTGVEGHETPLGTFEIQNRGEWFFNEKYQQGAKYWVSFKGWGVYLFHSLAMDKDQEVIPEEAAKLGQPASHGCIRLAIEDAKWIYDNIPAKTKVVIHE